MSRLREIKNRPKIQYVIHSWLLFGAAISAIYFIVAYRSWIPIELGFLAMTADVLVELRGTKVGHWTYAGSPVYNIGGRVPIEIPLLYFFMGVIGATYVLFRLGL